MGPYYLVLRLRFSSFKKQTEIVDIKTKRLKINETKYRQIDLTS